MRTSTILMYNLYIYIYTVVCECIYTKMYKVPVFVPIRAASLRFHTRTNVYQEKNGPV